MMSLVIACRNHQRGIAPQKVDERSRVICIENRRVPPGANRGALELNLHAAVVAVELCRDILEVIVVKYQSVLTPGCNADWVDGAAPLKVTVGTNSRLFARVQLCSRIAGRPHPWPTGTGGRDLHSPLDHRHQRSGWPAVHVELRSNRLNHIDARENAKWTRWIMLDFEQGLAFQQLNFAPMCREQYGDAASCVQMNDGAIEQ